MTLPLYRCRVGWPPSRVNNPKYFCLSNACGLLAGNYDSNIKLSKVVFLQAKDIKNDMIVSFHLYGASLAKSGDGSNGRTSGYRYLKYPFLRKWCGMSKGCVQDVNILKIVYLG